MAMPNQSHVPNVETIKDLHKRLQTSYLARDGDMQSTVDAGRFRAPGDYPGRIREDSKVVLTF